MAATVLKVFLGLLALSALVAVTVGKAIQAHLEPPEPVVPPVRLAPLGRRDYRAHPVASRDRQARSDLWDRKGHQDL